jgi:protein TonB
VFDGFEDVKDEKARKRWFASAGTSLIIYGVVGVGLLLIARQTVQSATAEPPIDVTFRESTEVELEPEKPPPPPPPTAAAPKPKRPGKLAPLAPAVIPEARPDETTPTDGAYGGEIEEFGDGEPGSGIVTTTVAPPPEPPPPPPAAIERAPDPIDEIDTSFTPARAVGDNAVPIFPDGERRKGVSAEVVLKIKISDQGKVVRIDVISGAEPFVTAAKTAVATWRYHPALEDGRPIAYVLRVKIPFRIKT